MKDLTKLRKAIERLVDAEIAHSWKGGGDSSDIPYIEQELELAKVHLELVLKELK